MLEQPRKMHKPAASEFKLVVIIVAIVAGMTLVSMLPKASFQHLFSGWVLFFSLMSAVAAFACLTGLLSLGLPWFRFDGPRTSQIRWLLYPVLAVFAGFIAYVFFKKSLGIAGRAYSAWTIVGFVSPVIALWLLRRRRG